MPCHAGIDDDGNIALVEGAQAVIDPVVNFGMRFGILIEFSGRHAHLFSDLPLDGTRRIYFCAQLFGKEFADRRFSAA